MGPAADQLVRDYLSRLTVAARGRLGPDDQRALVARTRDLIERQAAAAGPLTTLEVGRLLYRLGDPSTVVDQERQRLADAGGELPEPPTVRSPLAKVLRRDAVKPRGASWHWPAGTDHHLTFRNGHGPAAEAGGSSNGTVRDAPASDGHRGAGRELVPYVPAQPDDRDWFFHALGSRSVPAEADAPATDVEEDATAAPGEPAPTPSPSWQPTTARGAVLRQQLRRLFDVVATWYRDNPLEASAVVLLGLGGAIYPPVWLIGAAVALASRAWDGRDKWLGLALPILLTIIAACLGVTVGGHVSFGHGIHEGWAFGVAGSRVAAILSASYLCWRSVHERRPPAVPPWNRPHKVG